MKVEFVNGEVIVTYRMRDGSDAAAAEVIHGQHALWECRVSWADAPKTAKLVFKPIYRRLEGKQ